MSNLLFFEAGVQGTSLGELRFNQLVTGESKQKTSPAFLPDLSEPIFSGIETVTPGADGDITIDWSVATGTAEAPIRYRVYAATGNLSATALFVQEHVASVVESSSQARLFTLGDGQTVFVEGSVYTFGVRAISAVGIGENNISKITVTAISTGNPTEILQDLALRLEKSAAILVGSGGPTLSIISHETTMSFSGQTNLISIEMDGVP